jgi:hypothetical protein
MLPIAAMRHYRATPTLRATPGGRGATVRSGVPPITETEELFDSIAHYHTGASLDNAYKTDAELSKAKLTSSLVANTNLTNANLNGAFLK